MDITVISLSGVPSGNLSLSDEIFAVDVRGDLLQRMVRYQLAKRRQGTHAVKNRADIRKTGAKMFRQKGTGRARHSSSKVPQFRGGGRAFGPTPRDHSIGMPKKVRSLALRHALSNKAASGDIVVLDKAQLENPKTAELRFQLKKLGLSSALIIAGNVVESHFSKAAGNIPQVDVLPVQGINVYDILRRKKLVLTKDAVEALEERFK